MTIGSDTKAVVLAAGLIFLWALLLATFVELSGFSTAVNLIAAFVPIFFFAAAIAGFVDGQLLT